jgi:predicted dehydrogenase
VRDETDVRDGSHVATTNVGRGMDARGGEAGIGVIGYGRWGANYVRVFQELDRSRVVAICDGQAARLSEAVRHARSATLTNSLDELLDMPDVDAVVVATPASTHYDVTRRCLAAQKHVLVEKPFTTIAHEGDMLAADADERGLVVLVGHTFLYNVGILKLKEAILESEVGDIYYMYSRRTNLGPVRDDVNALWDLAPHDVAIFNYLTDAAPLWVSAVGSSVLRDRIEDVGFVCLGYPDDRLAHIHVSWTDPDKVREIVVVGSRRRVLFNDTHAREQLRIFEKGVEAIREGPAVGFGEFRLQMRDGYILSPPLPAEEPLKRLCQHFLGCILDGDAPLTDGRAGSDVVRVMEAIDASLARRGVPVVVPQREDIGPAVPATASLGGRADGGD